MVNGHLPPPVITIRFCPTCGRNNRHCPFTGKSHWHRGVKCAGSPVDVDYALIFPEAEPPAKPEEAAT